MSKPDIIEGKVYKFSHTDTIVVQGKIWYRDHYYTYGEDVPLMFFHPTQDDAPTETRMEKLKKRPKPIRSFIRKFGE